MFVRAVDCNLFTELSALCKYNKRFELEGKSLSHFDKGRQLLYGAIGRMIQFDPQNADMKEDMTDEEKELWKGIQSDIRKAGEIILKLDADGLRDIHWVLSFIPRELHRDIEYQWDGIVCYDGTVWMP